MKWPAATVYVSLSVSLTEPQPNIKAGSDVIGSVRRAMRRWSDAGRVTFVELSTATQSVNSIASSGDGINLITVARTRENATLFRGGNSDQPGRTRVFYDASGNIVEADIALNPSQRFSTDGTFGTFDLESTFTHEIGHMLGLDHSTVVGAVMQPRQAKNGTFYSPQFSGRVLSSDDFAGIQALYGGRLDQARSGAITGSITFPGGAPAGGVNLWAEDANDGRVVESAVTRAGGLYRLGNLPPSFYYLYAGPLDGPIGLEDFESSHGAYLPLGLRPATIHTAQIGRVEVRSGATRVINAEVTNELPEFMLSVAGLNNQASSVAVPLVAGNTYTLYAGGKGVVIESLLKDSIKASSPFIHVDQTTISQEFFGPWMDVISFNLRVDTNAPAGTYSLWVRSKGGTLGCLVGALVVGQSNEGENSTEVAGVNEQMDALSSESPVASSLTSSTDGDGSLNGREANPGSPKLLIRTLF